MNKRGTFKIIAIRPLHDCDPKFIKVLIPGYIYKFYNNYEFIYQNNDPHKEVISIDKSSLDTEDLYNPIGSRKNAKLNVSAIVGKNGSGKSTIVELLYIAMYNISIIAGVLPKFNDDDELVVFEKGIKVEIYYLIGENYFKIKVENQRIKLYSKGLNPKDYFKKIAISANKDHLSILFYSIVINYSHHALNSKIVGNWVKNVFQKNDGYQTPIVINPYRKEGNIDINNEDYLTRSRLIANILIKNKNHQNRILAPGKTAHRIKFTLNVSKSKFEESHKLFGVVLKQHKTEILSQVFRLFSKPKSIDFFQTEIKYLNTAFDYILKKLYFISERYDPYTSSKFLVLEKPYFIGNKTQGISPTFYSDKFKSFIQELATDTSHITFKLRQAINFIENSRIYKDRLNKYIEIEPLSVEMNEIKGKKRLIDIIPPSFFNFDIKFEGGSVFNHLSSGEKQKIFTSATLLYHIFNIDSVRKRKNNVKYRNINIIFDEIELYFHPELQRTFLKNIIDSLAYLNLNNIDNINFIFITHSPFILSDIPHKNVLYLEIDETNKRSIQKVSLDKTFGANIHDLLANDFYMDSGFMGDFARSKIEEVILHLNLASICQKISKIRQIQDSGQDNFELKRQMAKLHIESEEIRQSVQLLNSELINKSLFQIDSYFRIHRKKYKNIIELIGESVIRKKLTDMYEELFNGLEIKENAKAQILKLSEESGIKIKFQE